MVMLSNIAAQALQRPGFQDFMRAQDEFNARKKEREQAALLNQLGIEKAQRELNAPQLPFQGLAGTHRSRTRRINSISERVWMRHLPARVLLIWCRAERLIIAWLQTHIRDNHTRLLNREHLSLAERREAHSRALGRVCAAGYSGSDLQPLTVEQIATVLSNGQQMPSEVNNAPVRKNGF